MRESFQVNDQSSGHYTVIILVTFYSSLTMLHSETCRSSCQMTARTAMIFVLLVQSVCLEKFADAIQQVHWVSLRRILGKRWDLVRMGALIDVNVLQ